MFCEILTDCFNRRNIASEVYVASTILLGSFVVKVDRERVYLEKISIDLFVTRVDRERVYLLWISLDSFVIRVGGEGVYLNLSCKNSLQDLSNRVSIHTCTCGETGGFTRLRVQDRFLSKEWDPSPDTIFSQA